MICMIYGSKQQVHTIKHWPSEKRNLIILITKQRSRPTINNKYEAWNLGLFRNIQIVINAP